MDKIAKNSKKTIKQQINIFWIKTKKYFSDWKWWDYLWILVANLTVIIVSIVMHDTFLNIITALTGVLSVIFAAKGKVSTFYFGIINVIIYSTICFFNELYINYAIYFFFFLPCNIIGIFTWGKNLTNSSLVKTRHFNFKQILLWLTVLLVILTSTSFLVNINYNDLTKSFLDSSSSIVSMSAMLITVLRYREQWLLWVICNILAIAVWTMDYISSGDNIAILIMWVVYLLNSIYGLFYWYFILNKRNKDNKHTGLKNIETVIIKKESNLENQDINKDE